MALVDSVPAGVYGKQALTSLGQWEAVAPQVVQAENVRAALAYVATGEAALGIVYATDAHAEPGVTTLGSFPESTHAPIIYPAALMAAAGAGAQAFFAALRGPKAQAVFREHGFTVLVK
jgi:molybdate transport system substrate-binding protein